MPRPYVVGDSSPFLKRVLIPFWIVRCCIMVVQIGLYGIVIAGLGVFRDDVERLWDEYHTDLSYNAVIAVSAVIMVIVLVCLILDIVSVIQRARRTLSPFLFLSINITQSIFYVVNFILAMIGPRNGVTSIVISVLILLSFLGLLLYASIVYHQFRTGKLRGTYVQTNNPEVHNLVTGTGYPAVAGVPAGAAGGMPASTAYPPQAFASEYPKQAYYDQQSAVEAQAFTGGYAAPQAYEPYRSVDGHAVQSELRAVSPPIQPSPSQSPPPLQQMKQQHQHQY